jgi:protoporphyrinogen oxidase
MACNVMHRAIVIGAGPAGLTAAVELLKCGYRPTVLEADTEYVGGLSRTVRHKQFRFDLGGHRFFSKNEAIVKRWKDTLPEDFTVVRRKSHIYFGGKLLPYPLKPLASLRHLGLADGIMSIGSYCFRKLSPIEPECSFEDWVCNRFGDRLYETFFRDYTEKVWGLPCSEISNEWAAQRIGGLSLSSAILNAVGPMLGKRNKIKTLIDAFYYPRLGPGMMWEKTRDDIVLAGGRVLLGRKAVEIKSNGDRIVSVTTSGDMGTEQHTGDLFIVSMPLEATVLAIRPVLPDSVLAAARALSYRGLITVSLIIKNGQEFEDNWLYIQEPELAVGRIQNFRNWSNDMVPIEGVTSLGLEYFCTAGDSLWNSSEQSLCDLAWNDLCTLRLVGPGSIRLDGKVVRMPQAYPVYSRGYSLHVGRIRAELARFRNLQVVGRNGMFRYNNQDHSMMTAILACRRLEGEGVDPWLVNSDAEYIEAGGCK